MNVDRARVWTYEHLEWVGNTIEMPAVKINFSMWKIPFSSYDTRGSHAGTPSHWKDEEILENRAIFRTIRSPAELVIKPVQVRFPPAAKLKLFNKKTKTFPSRLRNFIDFFSFFFFNFFPFLPSHRRKTLATFDAALTLNFLRRGIVMWTFKL